MKSNGCYLFYTSEQAYRLRNGGKRWFSLHDVQRQKFEIYSIPVIQTL